MWRYGFNWIRPYRGDYFFVTLRTWLGSAQKLCQNAFQTISDVSFFNAKKYSAQISDRNSCFSLIWHGFWQATTERMSNSASSSNFAVDRLIQRSVRPKNLKFGSNLGSKIFTWIAGIRFSGGIVSTASNTKPYKNFSMSQNMLSGIRTVGKLPMWTHFQMFLSHYMSFTHPMSRRISEILRWTASSNLFDGYKVDTAIW